MNQDYVVPAVPDSYDAGSQVQYLNENMPVANTTIHYGASEVSTSANNGLTVDSSGVSGFDGGFATNTLGNLTLPDLVQMFVVYAFIIAAALSAVFIFFGGVSFILSGGNDEKIKQAVNTIRYSIIGLIVTILSFTFVTIVGRIFGLDFMDYLSYDKIKNSINQLVTRDQAPSDKFEIER